MSLSVSNPYPFLGGSYQPVSSTASHLFSGLKAVNHHVCYALSSKVHHFLMQHCMPLNWYKPNDYYYLIQGGFSLPENEHKFEVLSEPETAWVYPICEHAMSQPIRLFNGYCYKNEVSNPAWNTKYDCLTMMFRLALLAREELEMGERRPGRALHIMIEIIDRVVELYEPSSRSLDLKEKRNRFFKLQDSNYDKIVKLIDRHIDNTEYRSFPHEKELLKHFVQLILNNKKDQFLRELVKIPADSKVIEDIFALIEGLNGKYWPHESAKEGIYPIDLVNTYFMLKQMFSDKRYNSLQNLILECFDKSLEPYVSLFKENWPKIKNNNCEGSDCLGLRTIVFNYPLASVFAEWVALNRTTENDFESTQKDTDLKSNSLYSNLLTYFHKLGQYLLNSN